MTHTRTAKSDNSLRSLLGRMGGMLLEYGPAPLADAETANRRRVRLFLTSFVLLYVELICIRWIPSYVRYLSYFTNFILLAAFLGIGIGILLSDRKRLLMPKIPVMLFLLICVGALTRLQLRIPSTQVLYYGAGEETARAEHWIVLPVIFALVTLTFIQLARPLGRLLTALPPLEAYAIDILGSLAGTAGFFVMSYLSLPPLAWMALLFLALFFLLPKSDSLQTSPFILGTLILVYLLGRGNVWSPYYRIQVTPNDFGGYMVNVNNVSHQEIMPYPDKETFYFRVYDLLGDPPFRNVLVLGAGTGADVEIALRNGALHVDAVEIDPEIYRLGVELHPDKPYDDPRVSVYVDDGRAFLRNTDGRYDLIVFALPDSLTLTSSFASVRLESFLLTTDAFESARGHLTSDGAVVLYNYYREEWLVRKLAAMLDEVFDSPPFVTTYGLWGRASVLIEGPRLQGLDPAYDVSYAESGDLPSDGRGIPMPLIGQGRMGGDSQQSLATDDWPFVYMPVPTIPTVYLAALGVALAVAVGFIAVAVPRAVRRRFNWHFFFLGAAFMLLETRSLITFALLFGTTWMVNSLVFFAILCSVLLAVLCNARFKLKRIGPLYALLFGLLAVNYFLPSQTLLSIPVPALRYTLASLLAFAPIFLANVIFSHSFRDSLSADIAFGSNLLGAMAGGVFEYAALAMGYQFLLLPVMAFYAMAYWLRRRAT
jgi:spermidine synthase